MAFLFGSTMKHGILTNAGPLGATSGLVNRKFWDTVANTAALATSTVSPPPGGDACLQFPSTIGAAAATVSRVINNSRVVFGFWFRKDGATNPTTVNPRVCGCSTSNHTVRFTTAGLLQIGANGTNFQTIITPAADTWYWITVDVNTTGGTHTVDAKAYSGVDGTLLATATQSTAVLAATPQLAFIIGPAAAGMGGMSFSIGPVTLFDAGTDYPILPQAGELIVPNACGTHSFVAGDFVNDAAAAIVAGETTSWQKVDEWPANTTDWVRQNVDNANGYLEYDFAATTALRFTNVKGVQLLVAHLPSTTGANLVGWKLRDQDAGVTSAEATIDVSTAAVTLEYGMHTYPTRPGGGAWTVLGANTLRGRFGYMTLQPAQAGMSAIGAEIFGDLTWAAPSGTPGPPLAAQVI